MQHEIRDQWWSKTGTRPNTGKNPAIRDPAFLGGYPSGNELIRGRVNDRFAGTQKKADQYKKKKRVSNPRRYESSEGGENSPPQHTCCQHASGTKAVSEPAPQRLEERIAYQ